MLNNRDDDKFEGHEESEYHFSDEEVSYEAEPEPVKASVTEGSKAGLMSRVPRSKRLWISVAVFLVLIFIVYKMVTPSSTTPPLDIAVKTSNTAPMPVRTQQAQTSNVQTPSAVVNTQAQNTPNLPPSGAAIQEEGSAPAASASPAPAAAVIPAAVSAPSTVIISQPPLTNQAAPMVGAPAVIPVQSVVPQQAQAISPTVAQTTSVPMYQVPGIAAAETRVSNMAAERERLEVQFQAEYAQKVNDFTAQAKVLQDQVQTLTSRVAGLEAQLSQLIQTLSRQNQGTEDNATSNNPPSSPSATYQSAAPKIAFSVQAIIPGRAWLKSDNGDTVTVAEGDVVKDLGRITKIDPYDGIVEINTGTKVVSLSYGNAS
jgi:hypothetical protein